MTSDDLQVSKAKVRLAVYGTLAPGKRNHHQLAGLKGHWRSGTVHARLVEAGWGATLGFPGPMLDEQGDAIEVQLFECSDLPTQWERLDAFEGAGYSRVTATIAVAEETLAASIYVVAAQQRGGTKRRPPQTAAQAHPPRQERQG